MNSTLAGERIRATIDADSIPHIMSVLTDLYEDPEMAIIREYSTNALDAHVEAGTQRPIEITLPSALSPFLRIKDYGVGLVADDIRDIYSKYGTSTKRNSNDVVGMLGLGCKSALTYTDQFTVTSVKDETLTTVSVSRDEDGGASFTIVNQERTAEPNGTEVIIPAKRDNAMVKKATEFFQYWKPGTVLVNGEAPTPIEGIKITDDLLLIQARGYYGNSSDVVVMGNVPYAANIKPQNLGYNSKVVAWVPIGAVAFTPSREALQDTRQNREALEALRREVNLKLQAALQARIEEAPTAPEAVKVYLEVKTHGFKGDAKWRGHDLPEALKRPASVTLPDGEFMLIPGTKRYRQRDGDRYKEVSMRNAITSVWIENFDNVGFTPTMRQKLTQYRQESRPDGEQIEHFILVDKISPDERKWLRPEQVWDWTPIGEIKISRKPAADGSTRPRGSYKGRQDGDWHKPIQAATIDTTKPVVYYHGNWWATATMVQRTEREFPGLIRADATIIGLEANRIDKFKRDFPMAKTIQELRTEHITAFYKKLDKDTLLKLHMDKSDQRLLALLDPSEVNDPALKRWIGLAKLNVANVQNKFDTFSRYITPPSDKEVCPLSKYPLVNGGSYYGHHLAHIYLYLNAAFAAERKAT